MPGMSIPQISFIVPAHDEAVALPATLAAIRAAGDAAGVPWEVLVVDDASTDGTARVASDAGARVVPVALRNIGAVRNAGARESQGSLLVFVDADTRVTPSLIAAARAAIAGGAIGGGARFAYDGKLPLYVRLLLPYVERRFERKKVMLGVFLFVTRDAFLAVGGFDERYFVAEEVHLGVALRKKGKLVRLDERVLTSGRKYRDHPWWRVIAVMLRIRQSVPAGRAFVQDRANLGYWYDARRRE